MVEKSVKKIMESMYGPMETKEGTGEEKDNIFPKAPVWMGPANRLLISWAKLKRIFLSKK
jgi:hypothetical protein